MSLAFPTLAPDTGAHKPNRWMSISRVSVISLLKIKVVPGSSRNHIAGWLGESLKIRVTANPEKGRANDAVASLLADTLRIPKQDVTLSSGASSPQKAFEISGLSHSEIKSRLSELDV